MIVFIGLAVGLIIGGLVICFLSKNAGQPMLVTLFWWVGIILAVLGLILVLAPVLVWIAAQIRAALGQP